MARGAADGCVSRPWRGGLLLRAPVTVARGAPFIEPELMVGTGAHGGHGVRAYMRVCHGFRVPTASSSGLGVAAAAGAGSR